uniref:Uncharacterized protein n=1 Tax=Glossina austeni TaxID=7395 RepID=A0A1A9VUV2_GLOAU
MKNDYNTTLSSAWNSEDCDVNNNSQDTMSTQPSTTAAVDSMYNFNARLQRMNWSSVVLGIALVNVLNTRKIGCEKLFLGTTRRYDESRYTVQLPVQRECPDQVTRYIGVPQFAKQKPLNLHYLGGKDVYDKVIVEYGV